jgi:O-antigen/teichoic acid export membrane protein
MLQESRPDKAPVPTGLASGVLIVTVGTYLTYAFGLLSNAIVAHGLAPADFGRYAYVVWLCGWLVLATNNGLTTSGIRFVAESLGGGSLHNAQRTHGYLRRLSRYSELVVLAAFTAVAWVIRPAEWQQSMPLFVGVVLISALAKSRYLFDISIAKGYGQFKVEAYSTVSVGMLTLLAWGILYVVRAPLTVYLLVFGASSVAYLLSASWQLRRTGVRAASGGLPPEVLMRLRRHLQWTMLLAGVGVFANKSVEVFFLNLASGPADVGFFTIGAALTRGGIDLLTSGLMTILMPVMSNAFGYGGEEHVNRIFVDSQRVFGFAGLLAAGVGFFLAAPTVELLYGPAYLRAIPAFQVMVLVSGVTLGEGAFGALLSTTDRQRGRAVLVVLQVAITIVFAAVLIPRYGFIGALIAHAVSRLLNFTGAYCWVNFLCNAKPPLRQWLRLALSAAVAALISLSCKWVVHGLVGDVLAAAVYGSLLVLLSLPVRYWTPRDFAALARSLQRYAPRANRLHRWVVNLGRAS